MVDPLRDLIRVLSPALGQDTWRIFLTAHSCPHLLLYPVLTFRIWDPSHCPPGFGSFQGEDSVLHEGAGGTLLPGQCQVWIPPVGGQIVLETPFGMVEIQGSCPSRTVMAHGVRDRRGLESLQCDKVALLPELESRNWSGRYFFHTGWNVNGLFLKYPSPLQAKERISGLCHTQSLSPQSASYSFIWLVSQPTRSSRSLVISWSVSYSVRITDSQR